MEYPFYLEQKFYDAGRLETRILTAQEAEALKYEDGYNSKEAIQSYLNEWEATKRAYEEQ